MEDDDRASIPRSPGHDTSRGPTRLGELLRRERISRGEQQSTIAAQFGITQPSYSRWESGRILPDDRHFAAIARFVGLDVEEVWAAVHADDPRPVTLEGIRNRMDRLEERVTSLGLACDAETEAREVELGLVWRALGSLRSDVDVLQVERAEVLAGDMLRRRLEDLGLRIDAALSDLDDYLGRRG